MIRILLGTLPTFSHDLVIIVEHYAREPKLVAFYPQPYRCCWITSMSNGVVIVAARVGSDDVLMTFDSNNQTVMTPLLESNVIPYSSICLEPRSIAVDPKTQHLFVANYSYGQVVVLNAHNGQLQRHWHTSNNIKNRQKYAYYDRAYGLAISNRKVYVALCHKPSIEVFQDDGTYLFSFGKDHLRSPKGVAVNTQEHVFVADDILKQILVFDQDGVFLRGLTGIFHSPSGITIDRGGNLIVTDYSRNNIQVISATTGEVVDEVRHPEMHMFATPVGVCADQQGFIWIADGNGIYKYSY